MDDMRKAPTPPLRLPSRLHALLYLCALATIAVSVAWTLATHSWDVTCSDTASAADCPTFWATEGPFLALFPCSIYLNRLARRTARSLAASGVPIKGWKGMPAWLTVELCLLVGLFIPVALRQLRERGG